MSLLLRVPSILSQITDLCLHCIVQVDLEFADSCRWEWFCCPPDTSHSDATPDPTHLQRLSLSCAYWPSSSDSGHRLLLKCVPISSNGKQGDPETAMSAVVADSPKVTPITKRHLLTPFRLAESDTFRMVTYNTLAGAFTSDEYARNILYSYCDPNVLSIEYRQGRIVHELLGYNADVLSLQEVGTDTFRDFFLPALNSKGYDGCHVPKSGLVSGLEATFHFLPMNFP